MRAVNENCIDYENDVTPAGRPKIAWMLLKNGEISV